MNATRFLFQRPDRGRGTPIRGPETDPPLSSTQTTNRGAILEPSGRSKQRFSPPAPRTARRRNDPLSICEAIRMAICEAIRMAALRYRMMVRAADDPLYRE